MTLCRFFQQGNCKFGNNCRFEHPSAGNSNSRAPQTSNRFGALAAGGGGGQGTSDKYGVSADAIEKDLTLDPPHWILSAYAPGRDAPAQLFGGYPCEQSFEELRLHYLAGKASGNEQQALNEAQELYQNAQKQIQNAIQNVSDAASFVISGENKHPNRHDICREGTQGAPFGEFLVGKRPKSIAPANPFATAGSSPQPANPFGLPAKPPSAFGQPSAPPAQTNNPFGQPAQGGSAFGQPPPPVSAFGQPSTLGAKPNPFGTPAFGQPAQANAQGSAFGQQQGSAFGQPSQSPFGQPSQPTAGTGFGQPSQTSTQGSAFGQPSQLGQKINPFASTAAPGSSPFANVASAQPEQSQGPSNPFGAPSNPPSAASNPFGQPSQQTLSPFGKPSAPPANPFATTTQSPTPDADNPFLRNQSQQTNDAAQSNQQPSTGAFGQPSNVGSPFGQASSGSFSQPASGAAATPANPFAPSQPVPPKQAGAAATGSPYPPGSANHHPAAGDYISNGMDGRLSAFKGKPVAYKDGKPGVRGFDGTWRRIWFSAGPPEYNKDTELPAEDYDEKSRAQWAAFAQKGAFENGVMPSLAPPREATLWDF